MLLGKPRSGKVAIDAVYGRAVANKTRFSRSHDLNAPSIWPSGDLLN
jgi:hypothetical protein